MMSLRKTRLITIIFLKRMENLQRSNALDLSWEQPKTSEVAQDEDFEEAEGVPAQLARDTDFEDVPVQAEEVAKVLDTDTVVRCQMRQPMLRHIKEYITDQVLPASRLERIRMLEVAPMYEVNKAGCCVE